ncbi:hypothetical protein PRIC1_013314 [Phytophthora ramorum]
MNRATHAGFCAFDERNAGGRFQTQAELRRFKHVVAYTAAGVDCGEKGMAVAGIVIDPALTLLIPVDSLSMSSRMAVQRRREVKH